MKRCFCSLNPLVDFQKRVSIFFHSFRFVLFLFYLKSCQPKVPRALCRFQSRISQNGCGFACSSRKFRFDIDKIMMKMRQNVFVYAILEPGTVRKIYWFSFEKQQIDETEMLEYTHTHKTKSHVIGNGTRHSKKRWRQRETLTHRENQINSGTWMLATEIHFNWHQIHFDLNRNVYFALSQLNMCVYTPNRVIEMGKSEKKKKTTISLRSVIFFR